MATYGSFESSLADRYRLEGLLGHGGMGTVYRATDLRLGRPVAIKVLHALLTTEIGIARFEREVHIMADLHHQNIITVYDSGEVDGRLYYVMEYLGGESLRARLDRDARLSVEDAVGIVAHVGTALQYAHGLGVVHRDIKPANIILAADRACLVDFGVARVVSDVDAQRLTESGIAVGTPEYLSPEQAGAEKDVGPPADQYGLACVLFEMLTGEPPFTGPTALAISMRHLKDAPPSLLARCPDVPPALAIAVDRALRKAPDQRHGSVSDFVAAACVSMRPRVENAGSAARYGRGLIEVLKSFWPAVIVATAGALAR